MYLSVDKQINIQMQKSWVGRSTSPTDAQTCSVETGSPAKRGFVDIFWLNSTNTDSEANPNNNLTITQVGTWLVFCGGRPMWHVEENYFGTGICFLPTVFVNNQPFPKTTSSPPNTVTGHLKGISYFQSVHCLSVIAIIFKDQNDHFKGISSHIQILVDSGDDLGGTKKSNADLTELTPGHLQEICSFQASLF